MDELTIEDSYKIRTQILNGMYYDDYLNSYHFYLVRNEVYRIHKNACCHCKRKRKLNLHHKTYKHLFDFDNEIKDVILLCVKCHYAVHEISRIKGVNISMATISHNRIMTQSKKKKMYKGQRKRNNIIKKEMAESRKEQLENL